MGELRLEVHEFQNLTRWRWVLTRPDGALVADHEVRLDSGCWQFEAFADLWGYLGWHTVPDRRAEGEARIVAEVGAWIGSDVLGPVAAALLKARPTTVRVVVPHEAQALLFRPLELGHVRGKPLPLQGVTLVMQLGENDDGSGSAPVGDRLRVLGLFSLPEGGQPLNLRRERRTLVKLLDEIEAEGRAVDVRVLQYGVTRQRLQDVLEEDESWDVIHISGHGAPGMLLLEKPDGSHDLVTAEELADLLELAGDRVKLVTVSACWSAALTAAEQRRLLGLPMPEGSSARPADRDGNSGAAPGTLATELAERLGCAVLAMRYPVVDDFAIALSRKLYSLLAAKERLLPQALGMALREVVTVPPTPACPALSAVTPTLFGPRAVSLRLAAPHRRGAESYDAEALKMAGFPPQPERFVGRTGVMARVSAALATASAVPGVLLYGMPGGGKTACAVELAYTHEHAFNRLVWFKAPDEGQDITGALTDFALILERELSGFQMVHVLADEARLAAFLPRLTELVERRRVLFVIDNIESLLGSTGQWRDARWGRVVSALCAHTGLGRVLLTSRRQPTSVAGLRTEAVDALSLDEALLLARELPHLRALIQDELSGVERDAARKLVVGVLNIAQGHPKLLELADGQASDPGRLSALMRAGDQAWRETGGLPEGFFRTGESKAAPEDYLHVLAAWTATVCDGLTDSQRTLFWFLCCLEEADRLRPVLDDNWADLWRRFQLDGQPPDCDEALTAVADHGLVTVRHRTGDTDESYYIHPGVAAAGRVQAGKQFQDAVDTELGLFWQATAQYALEREAEDSTGGLVVHAGLAAGPYLLRQQEFGVAGSLIENAFHRDRSPMTAAAILPALQTIEASGQVPGMAGVLAKVLGLIDSTAAEQQMRAVLDAAIARNDYRAASTAAGNLIEQYRGSGRLADALTLAEQRLDYTKRAGLGPWSQLAGTVQRLQILGATGQAAHVLIEVQRLRDSMQAMPLEPDQDEIISPWNVRETLLAAGRNAALQLGHWKDTLELNGAIISSKNARGASAGEVARAAFNDYGPLLQLRRIDEALDLLHYCRQTFETERDIANLGKTLGALAHIEYKQGHGDAAIDLAQNALRYYYVAEDVTAIAVGHNNLGTFLHRIAARPAEALAHHIAAALIRVLVGAEGVNGAAREAAADLRELGQGACPPADLADLCTQVASVQGVDLVRLLGTLTPDQNTARQTFQELMARSMTLAVAQRSGISRHLAMWDPVIAAILAADRGDTRAAAALNGELDDWQDSADWGALVAALRRMRTGETSPELLAGLDEVDTAIVTRALDTVSGKVSIPAALWAAMPLGTLLGDLVAAASGDQIATKQVDQILQAMSGDPDLSAMAAALRRIVGGGREPGLGNRLGDPVQRAVVQTVLEHIGAG